ncbi:hypothetical protein KIN20_010153 [Parelaphostrongylus tenuis]|uniref:Uncharacterized protein n=1 Tax=Parelaphostrongylus tenuis TaxID=148309 RepID=A0AAD5MQ57_PARTN|nr:hypothetical protein KIN20_010153 [Parelaphostrongylus tenuis]
MKPVGQLIVSMKNTRVLAKNGGGPRGGRRGLSDKSHIDGVIENRDRPVRVPVLSRDDVVVLQHFCIGFNKPMTIFYLCKPKDWIMRLSRKN